MNRQRIVGVILVLVSMLAVVQSWRTTAEQRRFVQCQARLNDALVARTRVLTEVTDQERDAEREADEAQRLLFTDPVALKTMAERSQAESAHLVELFRLYQDALNTQSRERAEADKARAEHPVPPPPSEVCG